MIRILIRCAVDRVESRRASATATDAHPSAWKRNDSGRTLGKRQESAEEDHDPAKKVPSRHDVSDGGVHLSSLLSCVVSCHRFLLLLFHFCDRLLLALLLIGLACQSPAGGPPPAWRPLCRSSSSISIRAGFTRHSSRPTHDSHPHAAMHAQRQGRTDDEETKFEGDSEAATPPSAPHSSHRPATHWKEADCRTTQTPWMQRDGWTSRCRCR